MRSRPAIPSRVLVALLLAACDVDTPTNPSPPSAPSLDVTPIVGEDPSDEELAELPAEFQRPASIIYAVTDVGFVPAKQQVVGRAYMDYYATHAEQRITLDLRTDLRSISTVTAESLASNWLPAIRWLMTIATRAVTGSCGHVADANSHHAARHQALVSGWKALSWGEEKQPTHDSDAQPACPPPPVPIEDGDTMPGDTEYAEGCEVCQQWFLFVGGVLALEWWECTPEEDSACSSWS